MAYDSTCPHAVYSRRMGTPIDCAAPGPCRRSRCQQRGCPCLTRSSPAITRRIVTGHAEGGHRGSGRDDVVKRHPQLDGPLEPPTGNSWSNLSQYCCERMRWRASPYIAPVREELAERSCPRFVLATEGVAGTTPSANVRSGRWCKQQFWQPTTSS